MVNRINQYDPPDDDGDDDDFSQSDVDDGWACPAEREVRSLNEEFDTHVKEFEGFRGRTSQQVEGLVKTVDRLIVLLILAVGLLVAWLLMRNG